jgi:hypothetical protein
MMATSRGYRMSVTIHASRRFSHQLVRMKLMQPIRQRNMRLKTVKNFSNIIHSEVIKVLNFFEEICRN